VDALAGRAFDDVLLELTFGTELGNTDGHLDFATFPAALAELRRRDAIVDGTRVVAIHLSHRNPPPAELSSRLARWGATLHRDGDVLAARPAGSSRRRGPHRTLVVGGARSGKSSWAQSALAAEPAVTFVATAQADRGDPEWTARIAAHRGGRPAAWETVETVDLEPLLDGDGVLLVDDLGNWLSRALDAADAWNDPGGLDVVRKRGDALARAWAGTGARVVLVTNEVGQGVVPATPAGRLFRDELGRLNTALAAAGDEVVTMTAGLPRWLRGVPDREMSR
jgi:adenosylcobinamide kinase/adenosylcobinamide-phosphate guanylyltransferase